MVHYVVHDALVKCNRLEISSIGRVNNLDSIASIFPIQEGQEEKDCEKVSFMHISECALVPSIQRTFDKLSASISSSDLGFFEID